MTGMATAGEGVANFGQTADDLDEAFEEQFAILSNSFLRQVKVSVQGGSDVQARLVGEILEKLVEVVTDDPAANERARLLDEARRIVAERAAS